MNLSLLTPKDVGDFAAKFPYAYGFLLGRCLANERKLLANELEKPYLRPERRAWIQERLGELNRFSEGKEE